MDVQIIEVDKNNEDLKSLVKELDAYLKITDKDDHQFYNQFNGLENVDYSLVAYYNQKPIGCGALKKYDENSTEIKRMFVKPEFRGNDIAEDIIKKLEQQAKKLGFKRTILETGDRQVAALNFYKKVGYKKIANYPPYHKMKESNCFEKILK